MAEPNRLPPTTIEQWLAYVDEAADRLRTRGPIYADDTRVLVSSVPALVRDIRALESERDALKAALRDPVGHVADWLDAQPIGWLRTTDKDRVTRYIRHHGGSAAAFTSAELIAEMENAIGEVEKERDALKAERDALRGWVAQFAAHDCDYGDGSHPCASDDVDICAPCAAKLIRDPDAD